MRILTATEIETLRDCCRALPAMCRERAIYAGAKAEACDDCKELSRKALVILDKVEGRNVDSAPAPDRVYQF
jgi:hypothetical protein